MMMGWSYVILVTASAISLALVLLLILHRYLHPKLRKGLVIRRVETGQSLQSQNGIASLRQVNIDHHLDRDSSKKSNYYVFRPGIAIKPAFFNWADYPSFINEAVENGWSRFSFTTLSTSSPSTKSAKSLLCATSNHENELGVEIGWELCEGSVDFMQKVRLNPGIERINSRRVSFIRTGLPLPGPCLGNSSFPQEAYFEITILPGNENANELRDKESDESEGQKIKLISEDFNAKISPDSLIRITSSHSQGRNKINEDLKFGGKQDGKMKGFLVSVGLAGGGSLPLKIPGNYPGSIGFNSNGSAYLDGTKLVFDSENKEWGRAENVIGCGFNPSQKKVFFTMDSNLVHEIHCKTEEFSYPLYPTIAANTDITLVVNFGQSPFKYQPKNLQRTPNPCFIGSLTCSRPAALNCEDSKEIFSMGRIDSQWRLRSGTRSNNNTVNSIKSIEYDQESEGDLFEIVLDGTTIVRSPYTSMD